MSKKSFPWTQWGRSLGNCHLPKGKKKCFSTVGTGRKDGHLRSRSAKAQKRSMLGRSTLPRLDKG